MYVAQVEIVEPVPALIIPARFYLGALLYADVSAAQALIYVGEDGSDPDRQIANLRTSTSKPHSPGFPIPTDFGNTGRMGSLWCDIIVGGGTPRLYVYYSE